VGEWGQVDDMELMNNAPESVKPGIPQKTLIILMWLCSILQVGYGELAAGRNRMMAWTLPGSGLHILLVETGISVCQQAVGMIRMQKTRLLDLRRRRLATLSLPPLLIAVRQEPG